MSTTEVNDGPLGVILTTEVFYPAEDEQYGTVTTTPEALSVGVRWVTVIDTESGPQREQGVTWTERAAREDHEVAVITAQHWASNGDPTQPEWVVDVEIRACVSVRVRAKDKRAAERAANRLVDADLDDYLTRLDVEEIDAKYARPVAEAGAA